jgi:menaquinone-dependent protoporphyrinogen oxidase
MARILILYSSTDGHTIEICARLQQVIERHAHEVTVAPIAGYRLPDPDAIDKIVIGASIRYGRHSKQVSEFIDGNRQLLDSKPNAFFSVNIVARKPEKNRPETNPYMKKFLRQIAWRPMLVAVFAGKLDYPRYGFLDRMMIRLIMALTKGPTDPSTVVEFTDWRQVDAFARQIGELHRNHQAAGSSCC